jgi:hypothetical protein
MLITKLVEEMKQRQQQRKKQNLPGFFSCEGVAE